MYERIRIADFNPTEENAVALAKTYAEVFAGDPWNEVTKCIGCNRFFGPETYIGQICSNTNSSGYVCREELKEAYPVEKTAQGLVDDANRSGSASKVLIGEGKYVGFAIGFPFFTDDFLSEKYSSVEGTYQVLSLFESLGIDGDSFYISEVGIKREYRGNGYSNKLVDELTDQAYLNKLPLLMRTNKISPMVTIAKRLKMGQIMGPEVAISDQYIAKDGIMQRERKIISSGIPVNIMDPENDERVLFYAPSVQNNRQ